MCVCVCVCECMYVCLGGGGTVMPRCCELIGHSVD